MRLSLNTSFVTTTTSPSGSFPPPSSNIETRRTRSPCLDKFSVGWWKFGTFCWSEFSRLSWKWNSWEEFSSSSNVQNIVSCRWFRFWHLLPSDGFGIQENELKKMIITKLLDKWKFVLTYLINFESITLIIKITIVQSFKLTNKLI